MQPPNRCRVNAVSARYVHQAFAISEPLERFLPLVLVKLARTAKTHSTGLCALPTVICAGFDQMPLESGEAGEDRDQQLALRRRGVAPWIVQRLEVIVARSFWTRPTISPGP